MKPLYILSSSCISPQPSFGSTDLSMEIQRSDTNMLPAIEPDFTHYVNPVQIRRMSRALKMGFTTAMHCMQQNTALIPEAIIVGTGKGCLSDTEHFLHSIKEYKETALNATHFIHSTYNQLNGMIALDKKINSYNITYVHRGFSFEHTLLDAALLFDENEIETALVGSFDEMTLEHFKVKKHWGYWKTEAIDSFHLLSSKTTGTISGEGSAFYMVGKHKPANVSVAMKHVSTLFKPSLEDIEYEVNHILQHNALKKEDIDFVLSGQNGDMNYAASYQHIENLFDPKQILYFKHLCGEYDTATSFACWLGTKILETQEVPSYLFQALEMNNPKHKKIQHKKIQHILIYNNYFHLNQSLILLSLEE